MADYQISSNGIKALKGSEGLRLKAYQDRKGVWTIGYGHTGYVNGKPVGPGMIITEKEAEDLFRQRLPEFENAVRSSVRVPLTQNQYDVLVSLAYNIGGNGLKNSGLIKKLNSGDYRSPEDLRSLYAQNPSGLNNHAVMALDEANRNYLIGTGKNLAPISPMMGSTYTAMATGSPFIVDEQGNLINYQTGTSLGKIDSPTLQMQFAGGDAYKGFSDMLKAQQEAEKAKLVAEARNPYVLEQIQARNDAAQAKQNNWIQYQDEKALKKTVDGLIDTILMNSNFNETKNINELLSQANQVLAKSDPNLRPLILDRLRAVSEAQGIMYPPAPSN